jgi:predicted dehydrogenase
LRQAGVPVEIAAVVESDPTLTTALRNEWHAPLYTSVNEFISAMRSGQVKADAASVCVPTSAHAEVAAELLVNGLDILIEKPIATTVQEADSLVTLARDHQRVLQIGHLERFNPAITAIQPHLNRPMFFEAHRLSIFSPRALDVDVILDLMIHDLDIVLSIARSPVREIHAVGLPILSAKVDIANVRLEFESGCVANFTASRVSTERVRKLRFFQPHQYVSIDYARRDLLVIDVAGVPAATAAGAISTGPLPAGVSIAKPPVASGEPLRLEIEAFLDSVRHRTRPLVSGDDGRAALALALDINRAIAHHAQRAGLDTFRQ